MHLVRPSTQILTDIYGLEMLRNIEIVGRTCYKSESYITDTSAPDFVAMLIHRGHEAMLEHQSFSVRFICDRGVSHEIVRHRIAAYAQESTRYCNYSKEKFGGNITFIQPTWFSKDAVGTYEVKWMGLYGEVACEPELNEDELIWFWSMCVAERDYNRLIAKGWKPEQARSVLPNSLKTEIVVTMNLREWRHFFKLRTAKAAHPQMRELTIPLLQQLKGMIPVIFDDINTEDK